MTRCEAASWNIAKLKAKRPVRVLVMRSSREVELVDDMMASEIVGMTACDQLRSHSKYLINSLIGEEK